MELALRAGDEVGCSVVEELTLSAPLLLPPADGVRVQVVVGAADEFGRSARSRCIRLELSRFGLGVACRGCVERGVACSRPRICRCGRRWGRRRWM